MSVQYTGLQITVVTARMLVWKCVSQYLNKNVKRRDAYLRVLNNIMQQLAPLEGKKIRNESVSMPNNRLIELYFYIRGKKSLACE